MTIGLNERLRRPGLLIAPGVFDMVSARMADTMGFDALYMTGFGVSASHLGLPDAGLMTYTDMLARLHCIRGGTRTPIIADADTGFGGLFNLDHAVRGYEAAGASAIQIEDQEFPKKCGHTPGRRVVRLEDAVRRIKVAAAARSSRDFLIVARTDARTSLGLDEALRRGEALFEAGADILFIESPESREEMYRIGRAFDAPLLANMVEGGRTPILSAAELEELGYKLAIYPVAGLLASAAALRSVYAHLGRERSTAAYPGDLYGFDDFTRFAGFERVWAFDRESAADGAAAASPGGDGPAVAAPTPMDATSDLCDADDAVSACTVEFRSFGGKRAFAGPIRTVRCDRDIALIWKVIDAPGEGAVLVIDGGGVRDCALFGDRMARTALERGWAGVVVNGAVRDTDVLASLPIGVKALAVHPRRGFRTGTGEAGVGVSFGGVTFTPGRWLVADGDGVVTLPARTA